jgi:sodium/potassium-transporting ATPase subunit alpha
LRNWLLKRDVVFARTSPEQKLIIVQGCQQLSHCVAVTGDGVNDSPAIKKADIGIAMGKAGTEVAKDAADIILLDDDFSNIIKGIKQGRLVFDILKKIIRYNLCSNVTELLPFIGFVIFQYPLPLTTIMILFMDVGTNIYPTICFAYEVPEENLLDRRPRNFKTDRLCTRQLILYAYFFVGIIQCSACFLNFFATLNDYGFKPSNMFFFNNKYGILPNAKDVYNPYDKDYRGNTNAFISRYSNILGIQGEAYPLLVTNNNIQLDYTRNGYLNVDYRLFFWYEPDDFFGSCGYDSIGVSFDEHVCYRPEGIRHAQTSYFAALVIMQVINGICSRVKISSIFKHKMNNYPFNSAYFVQLALLSFFIYCPGLNEGIGFRALRIEHLTPCLLMFIMYFFFEELTKFLLRNVKDPDGNASWFFRYFNY